MKLLRTLAMAALFMTTIAARTADYTVEGQFVTIPVQDVKAGGPAVVRLQIVGDRIIRVQATPDRQLPEKQSLIVVEQTARPHFTVTDGEEVSVKTAAVEARVDKATGHVAFYNATGRLITQEVENGKTFSRYRVPDREIGTDVGRVSEEQRHGLTWRLQFDSPSYEAFYGLGQHQSEELNMKGRNEDLFQYNTKVSVPFVLSNLNYGVLWDSYSFGRFGKAEDYRQLPQVFRLYDRDGREGSLTGTYTDSKGYTIVRDEDSLYYEYACPDQSALAMENDLGGIRQLPQDFDLNGSRVVYEGYIEAPQHDDYQFILYYAGYIRVYMDGREVVSERWRTAWNPNAYKFSVHLSEGHRTHLRIEWQPDGGVSYCGLRVAEPRYWRERNPLSIWTEMAKDMDYYFIAGGNADEVIAGYRTLTGRAPVYPKWALGFWQSRERYKTQDEVESTLREFRRREIPIDNIVQDWNYWPEDQWGSHSFEASRYPRPQAMLDAIHQMGGRFMISVWPKFYCQTTHYQQLADSGWIYRQAVEDSLRDWVGPGYVGSFYDAYAEGARRLFWKQMDDSLYSRFRHGIDAWWMDASEPNVRDCTPMWYRKALCGPTALGTATEYFNAYSIVNADAIYNGQRAANPNARVFLLTRSGFAGEQRYSTATWSGDIGTRWEDMRAQMTAGLNFSLSGLPFWGMDQGGFCVEKRYVQAQRTFDRTGVETEDLREWRELQTRWAQFGAFVPLFRAHGQWPLREIWNVAPETHPAYRSFVYYDRLRYRLMPYLYSMAGWVHLRDYTMMRALVMDFNSDGHVTDIKDQWMFGPSLMACPVSTYKARNRSVYFPRQTGWYDLYTGRHIFGGQRMTVEAPYERIPVYVPEGGILPFGPAIQYSDERPAKLIHLYVYAGRNGSFTLYEDEGTNYNYEQGHFATIDITYDDATRTVTFGQRTGSFKGMLKKRQFNIVLITPEEERPLDLDHPKGTLVSYDGRETSVAL